MEEKSDIEEEEEEDYEEDDERLVNRGSSLMMIGMMGANQYNAYEIINKSNRNKKKVNKGSEQHVAESEDYLDLQNDRLQMQYSMEYQSLIQTKGLSNSQNSQTLMKGSLSNTVTQLPKLTNYANLIAISQENLAHSLLMEKDIFNVPQTT